MTRLDLFNLCSKGRWDTAGKDTQYKITELESELILSFAPSSSRQDWIDNLSFPIRPYRNMPVGWFAHGGIVRAWKCADDEITAKVESRLGQKNLIIAGYSHGGALAVLAHEWFRYHGYEPVTTTFGSPRVIWMPPKCILDRFGDLITIRNRGDIVTHLPPWIMGYRHVGDLQEIGKARIIGIKPHTPSEYREYL